MRIGRSDSQDAVAPQTILSHITSHLDLSGVGLLPSSGTHWGHTSGARQHRRVGDLVEPIAEQVDVQVGCHGR